MACFFALLLRPDFFLLVDLRELIFRLSVGGCKKNNKKSSENDQLYPYSRQATNRPKRHEWIYSLFGGIREVSLKKISNRDVLRVSPDSDTMSLRIFGGIGSIRLESHKNSLRLAR